MPFHNPLASLSYDSKNIPSVWFEAQHSQEKVKLVLRRHIITNLPWLLIVTALLLLPQLLPPFMDLGPFNLSLGLNQVLNSNDTFVFQLIYYLALLYYAFLQFLKWYFTTLIVTNKRVIDINFIPPLQSRSTQTELEEVQDIQVNQGGVFGVLFNFGDISIQTAGTRQNIILNNTPQPRRMHELLNHLLP